MASGAPSLRALACDEAQGYLFGKPMDAEAMKTLLATGVDPALLPPEFSAAVQRINYDSASLKINVALSELPDFKACPGVVSGPQHRGTIHICPDQDYIERGYDDAKYGRPSQAPVLECTIPSVVDPSVAPKGMLPSATASREASMARRIGS